MRFTKALLKKDPRTLTDEELQAIGKHFLKYPIKPVVKKELHRCIDCRWCSWYDMLGYPLWECQKNPCDDITTQSDRLLSAAKVSHKRYCEDFDQSTV